jgi:hypothetical protein
VKSFDCRTKELKRCTHAQMAEKIRKVRPGAFFLERVLGFTEFHEDRDLNWCEALWLEIPLSVIGLGKDFNFSRLEKMRPNVLLNRFEGIAQELNAKNRFAELAQENPDPDLNFPKTLVQKQHSGRSLFGVIDRCFLL